MVEIFEIVQNSTSKVTRIGELLNGNVIAESILAERKESKGIVRTMLRGQNASRHRTRSLMRTGLIRDDPDTPGC